MVEQTCAECETAGGIETFEEETNQNGWKMESFQGGPNMAVDPEK
jgi:hypothetical protein